MHKVLVLDIDGTLTNSSKMITPKTRDAIMAAQARGVKVVLASGRPTRGLRRYEKELDLEENGGFLLSFNGARLTKSCGDELIYERTLEKEDVARIYDEVMDMNVGMISYHKDYIFTDSPVDEYMRLEARINGMEIRNVPDFMEHIKFPVNKCLLTAPDDEARYCMEYLSDKYVKAYEEAGKTPHYNIYRSEPFFVEVMPLNIDKAATLEELCKYMGIDRTDLVCCGDGYNDVSMIRYAGVGVAMANARDEVKAVADFVTGSNDDDGIVTVIDKYF